MESFGYCWSSNALAASSGRNALACGVLDACYAQARQAWQRVRVGLPLRGLVGVPRELAAEFEYRLWRREAFREPRVDRRPYGRRTSYQSAWTTVPLCNVTIVALANHSGAAEDISVQFSVASCQCLAMPAGDS
jgi:hypothetical protein